MLYEILLFLFGIGLFGFGLYLWIKAKDDPEGRKIYGAFTYAGFCTAVNIICSKIFTTHWGLKETLIVFIVFAIVGFVLLGKRNKEK